MLESRGLTRKVEITCIVIALLIWVAALVFGYQTMLGPTNYTRNAPNSQQTLPTSIQFYGEPEYPYYDEYAPSASSQARADATP